MRKGKGPLMVSVVLLFLVLLSGFIVVDTNTVSADQDGYFTYTVTDGFATITGYSGSGGTVTIPHIVGGYAVIAIGDSAFYSPLGQRVTLVSIPEGVTSIGSDAFSSCTSLLWVSIPNTVTTIGNYAFSWCTSLLDLTIPDNITFIGSYAFDGCTSLISVTMPEGLISIPDYAFAWCYSLNSITIPKSVRMIGNNAFYLCTSLKSVAIPKNITVIGDSAFESCTSLTSINISDGVTYIGQSMFKSCPSLTSVSIPESVTLIEYEAFQLCTSLTSVTVPSSVKFIWDRAFSQCDSLTAIDVNVNNTNYVSADGVLYNNAMTVLKQFPGGKEGIFVIPSSVTLIENCAFLQCHRLTSVALSFNVTIIGGEAFNNCTSLTSINVSAGNLNFASVDGVLYNKDVTNLIQCPGGKGGAFTIAATVTSIENWAFAYCTALTNVTIPDSVKTIGDDAFLSCTNLTQLHFEGNAPLCNQDWIADHCSDLIIYYFGNRTGFTTPTWFDVNTVELPPHSIRDLQTLLALTAVMIVIGIVVMIFFMGKCKSNK